MRKLLIGVSAAVAVAAIPGVAAAQSGYVGLGYTHANAGGGAEGEAYGVEGAVAFGSQGFVFELDAALSDSEDSDTGYAAVGHVYNRTDSHLFGAFVGFSGNEDTETLIAGLEANKYYDAVTLGGAIFYGNNDDFDVDGYGINLELRAFQTENFRFNANLGWATVDDGTDDESLALAGLGGEYQFSSIPISIAAGYQTVEWGDADAWTIGLRYNFAGSLLDRDRNGASQASLAGIASLF